MIESYLQHHPDIDPSAWVHAAATVIGEVILGSRVSVWPSAVLRGDMGPIVFGPDSNLQDGAVVHNTGGRSVTTIGARVTVGHRAILHGCTVEDDCLIGMGAILLDNCHIEPGCVIGAGALVPMGRRIPAGSLVLGSPGRVARSLREADIAWIAHSWSVYAETAAHYKDRDRE
jgi:carbonic anhydrase/acetyltransferase-like protein (isoleucine patch superfamily)